MYLEFLVIKAVVCQITKITGLCSKCWLSLFVVIKRHKLSAVRGYRDFHGIEIKLLCVLFPLRVRYVNETKCKTTHYDLILLLKLETLFKDWAMFLSGSRYFITNTFDIV